MNIIFKKIISVSLALIFTLLLFASCTQNVPDGDESSNNKITYDKNLSVEINCISKDIFSIQTDESEHTLRKIVDRFNTIYPNVKLSITTFSEEDFVPAVKSVFEGTYKEHVDIIIASPEEILNVSSFEKAEDISDLMTLLEVSTNEEAPENSTEKSAADKSKQESAADKSKPESDKPEEPISENTVKINENIKNLATLGGNKAIFYPIAISANVMAFNKNILEKSGMLSRLPQTENRGWTFDEYKAFMTDLSAAIDADKIDGGVFYYGASSDAAGTVTFFENATGLDVSQVNTPEGIAFFSGVKEMTDSSTLVNGLTTSKSESLERFFKGEVASTYLYNFGIDLANSEKKKDGFEAIFMPMPSNADPTFSYSVVGATILKMDETVTSSSSTSSSSTSSSSTSSSGSSEETKTINTPDARLFAAKEFLNFLGNNKDVTGYFAGNLGMYSYKNEFNDFLVDEYAYLKQTVDYLEEYNLENNSLVDTSWINMLRKIFFLDEAIEDATNNFTTNLTNPPA